LQPGIRKTWQDSFNEAKKRLVAGDYILFQGITRAREILRNSEDSFEPLRNVDSRYLTSFLSKEHPHAIALVLIRLPFKLAAGVLEGLPDEVQADVAYRIVQTVRQLEEAGQITVRPPDSSDVFV
jgi:flagellar motor switch protein FliG